MTTDRHVYDRSLDTHAGASLRRLSEWIADAPGDVLDLGMGTGGLAKCLRGSMGLDLALDGVTINPAEATMTAGFYRDCWVDDLETVKLGDLIGCRRYRWIVCADVLEHLRNPHHLLRECHAALQPGGRLLVSIPNASYAGLIADLIHGHWRYGPEGLLDQTHVRFFTAESFTDLLEQTGWAVLATEALAQPWYETEFARPFDDLPPCVARYILAQPHTSAYQWLFCAAPSTHHGADTRTQTVTATDVGMASYVMSLYLDDGRGYRPERCMHALGTMGRIEQKLSFQIAAGQSLRRLRLDPADRPGYWHLREIRLARPSGETLWQWNATPEGRRRLLATENYGVLFGPLVSTPSPSLLVVLTNEDPQFELPIDPAIVTQCGWEGGTLQVVCDWPWSADYRAVIGTIRDFVPSDANPAEHPPVAQTKLSSPLRGWLQELREKLRLRRH